MTSRSLTAITDAGVGRINLVAAFEALAEVGDVDLVRVESDDTLIRVWIDDSETGQ